MSQQSGSTVDSNDKILAALGYIFVIIPIIMLLMEEQKNKAFIKYHSVQSIVLNVVVWVVTVGIMVLAGIAAALTFGLGAICSCLAFIPLLVLLWPAIDSFGGNYTVLPVITDFIKGQKWV